MSKLKFPHINLVRPRQHPGHVRPVYATAAGRPYVFIDDRESPDGYAIFTDDNEGRREARRYAKSYLKARGFI